VEQRLIDEVLAARARAGAERGGGAAAGGGLTPRQRIAALCDEGSFQEYGSLARAHPGVAGSPAAGLIGGVGRVDGEPVVVVSYDGQGDGGPASTAQAKVERLLFLALERRLPFICFLDGGDGRLDSRASSPDFSFGAARIGLVDGLCELSGLVPTVAVLAGEARDSRAAVVVLCDFVVAVRGTALGAGDGPPLPAEEHEKLGDVDCLVEDELAAVDAARRYLALLFVDRASGDRPEGAEAIADLIPENRRRPYDMRRVIDALADAGSVLELRPNWGASLITSLVRMGGRTVGIFANQPRSKIVGAIDADAADKMARFIELCDAFDVPLLSLIDSPGFHIGPEAERGGIARHHVRTLSAIEHREVPLYVVQVRKAYGLGPLVMRGSWGHLPPELRLAWPTVETGGMSLEGAAYLAKRKEILAAPTPEAARAIRDEYAETLRARDSGLRAGENFSFDDIVLPGETRDRVIAALALRDRRRRDVKRTYLDTI
jgi:acetyl-CoA carboxylase carboxyltransferase component